MTGAGSTLNVKLLRDLWRLRGQAVAIALVIAAGVGTMVMAVGLIGSLEATRDAYYDRYRFANVFAPLVRGPETLMARVRLLPGVAAADSRISTRATLKVAQVVEPVTARVHSLPPARASALNRLVLRDGRLPDPRRSQEVVANEAFVQAAGLVLGDPIIAVLHGKQVELRLVGSVLSPEYVYALTPGQIFPDNRRSAILWLGREPLAATLDLNQAFNDVLVRLAPGEGVAEVERRLDLLLAPYGGSGAYSREQQVSDRFVASEIDQLTTMAALLPPIFLLVAAFLLNIVLARLVDTEREVIGLLKAFGFPVRAIMLHYVQLAILLSLGGLALGIGLGAWLGRGMAGIYQRFFTFPFLEFRIGPEAYLLAVAATLIPVMLGATTAVWRSARLSPADAMRPEAPPDYSSRLVSWLAGALGPDEPSRIVARGLLRRPLRSILTVLGLAAATMLYVATASPTASIGRMIDLGFGAADRSDLVVTFAEPRDSRALYELERIPGVLQVQPFRTVGARLRSGHHEVREALSGIEPAGDLSRVIDIEGQASAPPPAGALLEGRIARQLGVGVGDTIEAAVTEGERPALRLSVAAVLDSPFGSAASLDRAQLNRLMREGDTLSGAYLRIDTAALAGVYARLNASPMVAGVTTRSALLRTMTETVEQNFAIQTYFYVGLAMLVVVGVVYNSARISLSERARDLASLRVLGFRRREVAFILLGEQALLVMLALPLGIWAGIELWHYLIGEFSTELFTIPFFIDPRIPARGVLVVAAAATGTAFLIRYRVDRLDLIRALKTRE
ncbi:ABC transporter permease [Sphingomonas sp. S1-29]|uniref:ABC transporter permease n=1 Tax=Sphingomonas sp. S1-29 TaxID=2991074 RepID=UPI0022400AB2|nr:ABC transporter permease [Sphingomonas sp. S1-29]UZK69679.1 ABC transporter permease [Sphingomonas sp. S1-29]